MLPRMAITSPILLPRNNSGKICRFRNEGDANLGPIGILRAVANHVDAHLTTTALDGKYVSPRGGRSAIGTRCEIEPPGILSSAMRRIRRTLSAISCMRTI